MNLILLFKEDFSVENDHVRLSGRRHKHIHDILKADVGDELCVGLENSRIGRGRVLAIDDETVDLDITLEKDPPLPLPLTLVLALPRPLVLRRVLIHATVFGVKKIILLHTKRVQKSYWQSPALSEEKIKEQFILGLEQAKDTIMPEIQSYKKFKPFVEDVLPGMVEGCRAFIAHPEGDAASPVKGDSPVILVIGPGGGFLPSEVEHFEKSGCKTVSFGERIMNVETAVIACITRLTG